MHAVRFQDRIARVGSFYFQSGVIFYEGECRFEVYLITKIYNSPNMSIFRRSLAFVAPLFCFLFAVSEAQASETDADGSVAFQYVTVSIPSKALEGNLTGDSTEQAAYVFLPPSYASGKGRYPVLYFFAGYYENADIRWLADVLPEVMSRRDFIIVSVNDINALHGSFGANSCVTGNWGDFFVNEAVPYVDAHFRTIASAKGRAVCGFSMGGHIALRLAFGHPEIFSILYAVSPGVFDENGLGNAMPTWDQTFLDAYGAAYAPNMDKPWPHADIPSMDGSAEDQAIQAKWNRGFGCLPEMVESYLAGAACLDAVCIEVGAHDDYPWIPQGSSYLSDILSGKGIPHSFVLTENRHEFTPAIFARGMGAFVERCFAESDVTR